VEKQLATETGANVWHHALQKTGKKIKSSRNCK